MEALLKNATMEMLREYYYDVKGEYPPDDFTREQIIKVILKLSNIKGNKKRAQG